MERSFCQILYRLPLTCLLNRLKSWASTILLLSLGASNNRRNMAHVAPPLAHGLPIEILKLLIALSRLLCYVEHHAHHTLKVSHTICGRLNSVSITNRLSECFRVRSRSISSCEPQPRVKILLSRPFIEGFELLVGCVSLRNGRVSPTHSEVVIGANLGD